MPKLVRIKIYHTDYRHVSSTPSSSTKKINCKNEPSSD